jgi:hypothetical protein
MMDKQRILVTVKTYPTLSRKYGETVCTAGLTEDGSWVRIYPVPFRQLDAREQYKKYDWIEWQLQRNGSDPRPETYRPVAQSEVQVVSHIDTSDDWRERRRTVLETARVYDRLDELIAGAKANQFSLAVFKPSQILDFYWEAEESRQWDPDKLREVRENTQQLEMFADNTWRETFRLIPKLPYSFSYRFQDAAGRISNLQVLDWEVGALFWNCRHLTGGDEQAALTKVKQKYFEAFRRTDLHFFLGTTQQFHFVGPNPWVIVGVFPAPHQRQPVLL